MQRIVILAMATLAAGLWGPRASAQQPKPGSESGTSAKAAPQQKGEDLKPEDGEKKPQKGPGPGDRRQREDWKPRPAKFSDWKITATKVDTEEKNGQKTYRYTDKVKAEMAIPGGRKIVVEAPRLVFVVAGDTPQRVEATGGFKASMPPLPGTFEADQFEMSFDDKGWPAKISIPKELRVSFGFGPMSGSGKASRLEVEFKDNQPQKGFAREIAFEVHGLAGPWSGGSARVKEIRGSRENDEIDFDTIVISGDHATGGFSAKADHGRVRSRRFRLFGNVLFSLADETFNADVVEVGEGEPIIESKDDKQILERIMQTIGIKR